MMPYTLLEEASECFQVKCLQSIQIVQVEW